jgi:hypothetical protein
MDESHGITQGVPKMLPREHGSSERTSALAPSPDVQFLVFTSAKWPFVAGSRRSGDLIHLWPPNGDFRPSLVSRDIMVERPLRSKAVIQVQLSDWY